MVCCFERWWNILLILLATFLVLENDGQLGFSGSESKPAEAQDDMTGAIDAKILERVRSLYPNVGESGRIGQPRFSRVEEVARATRDNGKSCSVIIVQISIPAAEVDHGIGDLLIFTDSLDPNPKYRVSLHSLPFPDKRIEIVGDRWFRFGKSGSLITLVDDRSLRHFAECGLGDILKDEFCLTACRGALNDYLTDGREKFLERAPVKASPECPSAELPNRIQSAMIYPSLNEEFRASGFKYSTAWEATMFAKVIPVDKSEQPVFIEFGVAGEYDGIDQKDVKFFVWRVSAKAPNDRPLADWQWQRSLD